MSPVNRERSYVITIVCFYFAEKHYLKAIDGYNRAIELNPLNHIYWSNRAFAHIRIEEFGAAIQDATEAIELDPRYAKAYYRRGDAHFALSHFKDAVANFRMAAKLNPRDPDLRRKLSEAERELKKVRFEEALALPEDTTSALNSINLEDILVGDDYTGPRMEVKDDVYVISLDFIQAMMDEFKSQRKVHKRFSMQIILDSYEKLRQLPSLVDVDVPEGTHITVCGDTHGQFFDLMKIFEINGLPSSSNPYVFNGDFVDRGSFSFEVIMTLLAFKAWDSECMHLTRGNHESKSMNTIYGFYGEVKEKMGQSSIEIFRELFCAMPLVYVLKKQVMVVHGGIPTCEEGGDLDSIRRIDRVREPPDAGPMCECLWNDPQEFPGKTPNKRGVGFAFGPDLTKKYLQDNGLSLLVRSHEVKDEGFELTHDGFCCTIFSAPNYCDQMQNKGAFIRFDGCDMVPHFTQFEAAPHPQVPAMKYASGMFGMM